MAGSTYLTGGTKVAVWIAYLEEGPQGKMSEPGSSSESNTTDEGPTKSQHQYTVGSSRLTSPETVPTEPSTPLDTIPRAQHTGQPPNVGADTHHHDQLPTIPTRISELQFELTRQSGIRAKGYELASRALHISLVAEEQLVTGREMVADGQLLVEQGRRAHRRASRTRKRGASYIHIADREERRVRRELTYRGFGTVSECPPTPISAWVTHHDAARSFGVTEGREDGADWGTVADPTGCRTAGVIPARWRAEAATVPEVVMDAWRKKLRQD